jgi:putative oxidoreductase
VTSQAHDSSRQPQDESAPSNQGRPGSPSIVDPEEDLPTTSYEGDLKTTTIPPYGAANPGAAGTGYGQYADASASSYGSSPSYVQPYPSGRFAPLGPPDVDPDDDPHARAAARRGTQDLGLLLLRVGLGALLIAHGLQKLFGWWGGQGLTGFKDSLSNTGYQHADILGYVAVGGQIVAGLLLVLGLFTPLAAAGALAHLINGVFSGVSEDGGIRHFSLFLPNGHEYQLVLVVLAAAIVLTGPGRYGFDAARGWARRPFIGSFVALLLGIGGGIALWVLLNGANPLS